MSQQGAKDVTDLNAWESPRLAELAEQLFAELESNPPGASDRMRLQGRIYDCLLPRLRAYADIIINQTIERWMNGLPDGVDAEHPKFCLELPYLEGEVDADPLTVVYAIDHGDGTLTELLRTTMAAALERIIDEDIRGTDMERRARVVAAELRVLVARLEGSAPTVS